MARLARHLVAPVAAVLLVALVGCTGPAEEPEPSPSVSASPSSPPGVSEEELREMFQRFVDLSADSLKTGVVPAAMTEIASPEVVDAAQRDVDAYKDFGYTLVGTIQVDGIRVTDLDQEPITLYACVDNSGTAVMGSDGAEVSRGDVVRQPALAEFATTSGALRIERFTFGLPEGEQDPCG